VQILVDSVVVVISFVLVLSDFFLLEDILPLCYELIEHFILSDEAIWFVALNLECLRRPRIGVDVYG